MIISIDNAGAATLGAVKGFRAGFREPLTISFASAPSNATAFKALVITPAANPRVLAFVDSSEFEAENATTWNAVIDGNDNRLTGYLGDKASASLALQLVYSLDGVPRSPLNVAISVQANALYGPQTSDAGPLYYTQDDVDALLASALASQTIRLLPSVVGMTGGGSTKMDGIETIGEGYNLVQFVDAAIGALRTYQLVTSQEATAAPGIIRAADWHTTANPKAWYSR